MARMRHCRSSYELVVFVHAAMPLFAQSRQRRVPQLVPLYSGTAAVHWHN